MKTAEQRKEIAAKRTATMNQYEKEVMAKIQTNGFYNVRVYDQNHYKAAQRLEKVGKIILNFKGYVAA